MLRLILISCALFITLGYKAEAQTFRYRGDVSGFLINGDFPVPGIPPVLVPSDTYRLELDFTPSTFIDEATFGLPGVNEYEDVGLSIRFGPASFTGSIDIAFNQQGGENRIFGSFGVARFDPGSSVETFLQDIGFISSLTNPFDPTDLSVLRSREFLDGLELPIRFGTISNGSVALDTIAVVPEPATWLMMIFGFAVVGRAYQKRQHYSTA